MAYGSLTRDLASDFMTQVEAPIFIVGCPRSGTGVLHQLVRLHPEVAWITPMTNWVCGKSWFRRVPPRAVRLAECGVNALPSSFLPPFLRGPYDGSLGLSGVLETHEGHSVWRNVFGQSADHHATEADISADDRSYLREVVRWHCRYHQRQRFLSKTPRNLFRLRALRDVFPSCIVVHLVRDGRAVVASILKRRARDRGGLDQWWGVRPPGWESIQSRSPIEQAAWTWLQCLEQARELKSSVPDDQFRTVYYERLVEQPSAVLRRLFAALDLDPDFFFGADRSRALKKIHPPPETWREALSTKEKEALRLLAPELRRQGYLGNARVE